MRWLYCWRCMQDMPMLDEEEYRLVAELYPTPFPASHCVRNSRTFF